MSNAIRIAVFALTLSAFPAAAQAQLVQNTLCRLIPSLCEQPAPTAPNAVPELDGSAASNALSLLVGAALIFGARRRRAA